MPFTDKLLYYAGFRSIPAGSIRPPDLVCKGVYQIRKEKGSGGGAPIGVPRFPVPGNYRILSSQAGRPTPL